MRSITGFALACAIIAPIRPASADTLRCGDALIEPGDNARYVLEKCGEPNLTPTLVEGAPAEEVGGYHPATVIRAGQWKYYRGPGKFPAVVTIGDDGSVEAIRLEKHREK